jgi:hypothetical protein
MMMWMALAMVFSGQAVADLTFTATEEGNNVVVTGVGTLNTDGLTNAGSLNESGFMQPDFSQLLVGSPTSTGAEQFDAFNATGPTSFGSGDVDTPDTGTGQTFGFTIAPDKGGGYFMPLFVPSTYHSGDDLTGSSTYNNSTFDTLGITPGTYQWTWGSGDTAQTITLQIGSAPEPSSAVVAVVGSVAFIAYGWSRHRREQRRQAAA